MGAGDVQSVVIADDEQPILDEFSLFPWEENQACLVGMARDGREALEMCRELEPSVLITDITMPGPDGMELSRILAKEQPGLAIVFLTCHRDFDYVRESMKNGAVDYLLKGTLEDEDIVNTLRECRQKILGRKSIQDRERVVLHTSQSEVLVKLMHEEIRREKDFLSAMEERGVCLAFPLSFLYVRIGLPSHGWPFLQDQVKTLLNRWGLWLTTGMGEFFLVRKRDGRRPTGSEEAEKVLGDIRDLLGRSAIIYPEDVPLYAVISGRGLDFQEFRRFIGQLRFWDTLKFYHSSREVFIYGDYPLREEAPPFSLLSYLKRRRGVTSGFIREELPAILTENLTPPEILKGEVLGVSRQGRSDPERNTFAKRVMEVKDLDGLIGLILHGWEVGRTGRSSWRREVVDAADILEREYGRSLGLSQVADRVGLTPSYLNRLFSEATGSSVNDYLLDIRLTEAKRLLEETGMKIYEIALKIGIPNYRYFSVIFRKNTGLSPGDWRKGKRPDNP